MADNLATQKKVLRIIIIININIIINKYIILPITLSINMQTHHQSGRQGGTQRPKKSELSGWQLSMRKNFPDEVRKSFSRQKKCA